MKEWKIEWLNEWMKEWKKERKGFIYSSYIIYIIQGSLEVKLPTIWTDGKPEVGRVREEKRREEKKYRRRDRESQKKEDAGARKGRKVAKHCVFPMICGSRGRKVGSLKRRVRSHLAGWEMISKSKCTKHTNAGPLLEVEMSKKCTPLWREAHFEVKSVKIWRVRSAFGSWDVEKVHVVVSRSTFPSQNVKSTTCSDHFWTFRCGFALPARGILHVVKS